LTLLKRMIDIEILPDFRHAVASRGSDYSKSGGGFAPRV